MERIECDLLVAGGGIAGICAAIAAARHGLDTVLLNDRSVLGGNASSEIGVGVSGAGHGGLNPAIYTKETGIIEEIRLRLAYYGECGGYGPPALMDAVLLDMVDEEQNIRLLLNTVLEGCTVEQNRITACRARHSVSNREYEIQAPIFIDATGNGVLAFSAGAEYRMGREGKAEFGEAWAPAEPDAFTMGNSIYFETADAGREVGFKPPKFAHDITKMDFLKDIDKPENFRGLSCFGPHWAYEYGGQCDILKDHDDIEMELRRLIYGIWDYVKNSGKYPKAKTRYLKRVFAKAGSRESRRFIGDYILTENDIESKADYPDAVCMGGWPMDIHAPLGIYDPAPASNFVPVTGVYNIPFRCLYSKDIQNLLLAGRDISVTHIALGSTRVMATCGVIGQAVGTAAAVCKEYGASPRTVYQTYMDVLQGRLLADDQAILHRRDCPLPGFTAQADSEKTYENCRADGSMPLERDYCLALMIATDHVDTIQIYLQCGQDTVLRYKLYHGRHMETYLPETLIRSASISLAGGTEGWVELLLDADRGPDSKLYVVLEKNAAIQLGISRTRPIGAVTWRMHTRDSQDGRNHDSVPLDLEATGYICCDHTYETERNILFRGIRPVQPVYSAASAINGYGRPYGTPNLWIPAGDGRHCLTLTAKEPVDAKRIAVLWDNAMEEDLSKTLPKTLARQYVITITTRNGIIEIQEDDNFRRQAVYPINARQIRQIQIQVTGETGIYGVKLFSE